MSSFNYDFEEVPVLLANGETWYAAGRMSLAYRTAAAEPDVGISRGWVSDLYCDDKHVLVTLMDADGERETILCVTARDPIIDAVIEHDADYIEQQCWDDQEREYQEACDLGYRGHRKFG